MAIFRGPPPGFMEALAAKYAMMQQESDAKSALQLAQAQSTNVTSDLAPALAGAQIGRMNAESEYDVARTGLANEGVLDARAQRQPLGSMQALANAIEMARRVNMRLPNELMSIFGTQDAPQTTTTSMSRRKPANVQGPPAPLPLGWRPYTPQKLGGM